MIFADTTWPEVASDALKIGLGALVGGFFAIVGTQQAHSLESKREYTKRRRDELEKIVPKLENIMMSTIPMLVEWERLIASGNSKSTMAEQEECANIRTLILELLALHARISLLDCKITSSYLVCLYNDLCTIGKLHQPTKDEITTILDAMTKTRGLLLSQLAQDYKET